MTKLLHRAQTASYMEEDLDNPSLRAVEQRCLTVQTVNHIDKTEVNITLSRFSSRHGREFVWRGSLKELVRRVERG